MQTSPLTSEQTRTLDALCRRMVPHAFAAPAAPAPSEESPGAAPADQRPADTPDLTALVAERLGRMEPATAEQVAQLLSLLEHPVTGLLLGGWPRRFTEREPAEQDEWLRGWERSRLGPRRTVFQALRRLILSTYYATPRGQRDAGYLGPLHTRDVQLAWEGPAPRAGAATRAAAAREALDGANDRSPNPAVRVVRTLKVVADEPVARAPEPERWPEQDPTRTDEWRRANRVPEGVVQGHELGEETTVRADVCVVGTGAGGAVAAARLAEAGHQVVLLEEGGYWTAADFTEDESEMTERLYAEGGARATDDLSISMLQGRAVGGSTAVNWMIMLRTPHWVLEEWVHEHGAEAMSPSEMAGVFEQIEREVHAAPVPDDAHSPNNRLVLDGARKLGWKAHTGRINARDCVRSGFCGLGCRYGAKQSTLVTFVPRALAAGARLYSDARVDRVELVGNGRGMPLKRVHATVLDRASGRPRGRLTVEAPRVVLAAGAVGTPAILQRSALGTDAVGRYLRLHPTTAVVGVYPHRIYAAAGIPLTSVCDEFLRLDRQGYGFWIECPPMLPGLAASATPGFGEPHRELMSRLPNLGSLIVLVRDGAEKGRSSGEVRVDKRGRTRIRYRLADADRRHLVQGLTAAARLHLAEGAEEIRTLHHQPCSVRSEDDLPRIERQAYGPNQLNLFSAHVNGTCRFGHDPRTSGCAPDFQVHGARGVYVADGSLLPTALGVNPQETIMALATLVARRIDAN